MTTFSEAKLKAKLIKAIRTAHPDWVVIAHQEMTTHGVPDLSVTGFGRTTWLECKLAKPVLKSKGVQDVTCLKLEAAGRNCYYIVWYEAREYTETLIVKPSVVFEERWLKDYEVAKTGYDHTAVVEFLERIPVPPMSERTLIGASGVDA